MLLRPTFAARALAAGALAGGCFLLVLRHHVAEEAASPTVALVAVFVAIGVIGAAWPMGTERAGPVPGAAVLAFGLGAFALGRLIGGGHPPVPFGASALALNSLAAVAEEAFFRRFAYGVLAGWGRTGAIVGSALLFAVVHLTIYGAWVLPLDLAAGLVLGWQRWASGRWSVPAITHVVANVLVMV
jgi:membrane protease YdiL (CAAX protease family)